MRCKLLWLLLAFVAAEIGLRIYDAATGEAPVGVLTDLIEMRGDYWTMRPNSAITQLERTGDTTYNVNALGYRGAFPSGPKTGQRVLILGDSISFGLGVEDRATYPRLLANRLATPARPVEVGNLAVFSYGPHEYLSTWRRLGKAFRPDVVVLQLYMNDIGAAPWNAPRKVGAIQIATALGFKLVQSSAVLRRAYQWANMAYYYQVRPSQRRGKTQPANDAEPRAIAAQLEAKSIETMEGMRQVHTLLREIRANGAKVMLVYAPNEAQLYDPQWNLINDAVRTSFADEADAYVDLTPTLVAAPDRAGIYVDGLHYERYGHRLITDRLAPGVAALLGR